MGAGVAALYAMAALAGVASGGSLDPPGPPGSTMRPLDELSGAWSRVLSSNGADPCNTQRFRCVLEGNTAVLDVETGLVWERLPASTTGNWMSAVRGCMDSTTGGRGGWRLPSDAELRSLLHPSGSGQPILPDGHPFGFTSTFSVVWTTTRVPHESDLIYVVDVDTLDVDALNRTQLARRWCVRGAQTDAPDGGGLAEQAPAWYQQLSSVGGCFSERFRCVLGGAAVLDRETGLVWERNPSALFPGTWLAASDHCQRLTLGSRMGWRLPSGEELLSLAAGSTVPPGHPFMFADNYHWSTTEPRVDPSGVLVWNPDSGADPIFVPKSAQLAAVCVRGGQSLQ
jgi:hypothetical protein